MQNDILVKQVAENKEDEIDDTLPPMDSTRNFFKLISYSWLNDLVNSIKKHQTMQKSDLRPLHNSLKSKVSANQIIQEWNKKVKSQKNISFLKILLKTNQSQLTLLFFCVIVIALCNVTNAIIVKIFILQLSPSYFYNCNQLFSENPIFEQKSYISGLLSNFQRLWGFLLLTFFQQLLTVLFNNISFYISLRMSTKSVTGLIDLLYQKLLKISDQTRQNAAAGNIVNLLFSDTMKIALLMFMMPNVLVLFMNIAGIIINLIFAVKPAALVGLAGYLIVMPFISTVSAKTITNAVKIMGSRDYRLSKTTEVLNGIKVVKLFGFEKVQTARLQNCRKRELRFVLKFAMWFSLLTFVAYITAPILASISYIAQVYLKQFEPNDAFLTMFIFDQLSLIATGIPFYISMLAEASISAKRIRQFLQLADKQEGVVVSVDQLNQQELGQLVNENVIQQDTVIKVVGKPSFTWALGSDKIIPPIFDPIFKKKNKMIKKMIKQKNQLFAQFKKVQSNNFDNHLTPEELKLCNNIFQNDGKMESLDDICVKYDLPVISKLKAIDQYDNEKYQNIEKNKSKTGIISLFIQLESINWLLAQQKVTQCEDDPTVIKQLDFEIKKGELVGLCGKVGCGKTSFFNTILGEMQLIDADRKVLDNKYKQNDLVKKMTFDYDTQNAGESQISNMQLDRDIPHIYINGNVAYYSQQQCIFSKSVKDNIVFGQPYDEEKYTRIVNICCLIEDLSILPQGDQTVIGGKGVTLSGGQKARIALARAVYADTDILLLDDPLSAVDAHVGKALWDNVIIGYLKANNKTIIISSHQTQFFAQCNRVIQLEDGQIKNFNTVSNLLGKGVNIVGVAETTNTEIVSTTAPQTIQKIQQTEKQQTAQNTMSKEIVADKGNMNAQIYKKWLTQGNSCLLALALFFYIFNQGIFQYQTILITQWSTDQYKWSNNSNNINFKINCTDSSLQQQYCDLNSQWFQKLSNTLISSNSNEYMSTLKHCYQLNNAIVSTVYQQTSIKYLWLYVGLTFALIVCGALANMTFAWFNVSISRNLHSKMLLKIINTKLSFFDTTPQGTIINRFAKDTDSVDTSMMRYAFEALITFVRIIGMLIPIFVLNWPAIIIFVPCLIIFIMIFVKFRVVYPQIKRLQSVVRSPVYNQCGETLDNLVCIRTFKQQNELTRQLRVFTDTFGSIYQVDLAMTQWMYFRMGMLSGMFAFFVVLVGLLISPYDLIITRYIGMVTAYGFTIAFILMYAVQNTVYLEGEMASVERILEYHHLSPEQSNIIENEEILSNTDKDTAIEFVNLRMRYRPELDLVLKGINLKIKKNEHIGIVGRTGSGKSSLTVALYRIAEPEPGSQIIVDNTNILKQSLQKSRNNFTIIPQDPFLFSGTLRQSLCQFSKAQSENVFTTEKKIPDDELWRALELVQMKDYFCKLNGLETTIALNGDNLSAGQRQLVCAARALLKPAKCVILDEATAQIDKESDQILQRTIRTVFKEQVVLAIAHRLDTIIDFDRILVMDNGVVAEFDTPANLLRNEQSLFSKLVSNTGVETQQILKNAAFNAEKQKIE